MPSFLKTTLETPLAALSEPAIDNDSLLFLRSDQKQFRTELETLLVKLDAK